MFINIVCASDDEGEKARLWGLEQNGSPAALECTTTAPTASAVLRAPAKGSHAVDAGGATQDRGSCHPCSRPRQSALVLRAECASFASSQAAREGDACGLWTVQPKRVRGGSEREGG